MRYLALIMTLTIYSLSLQAQPRYALVIGNSNYPAQGSLTNPINDAKDMKTLLTNQLGFTVIDGYDVNKRQFKRLIQKFNKRLRKSESPAVALFYFSGHGFSGKDQGDNDTNYLVPLWPKDEAPTDQVSLEDSSISSNYIVTAMRRYNKKGINLMVLDACRGSPKGFVQNYQEDEEKGSSPGGFVNMASSGVFLAYSTALGRTSYGATDTRNSIYTAKLLDVLKDSTFWHKNITEVFNETAFRVATFTEHFQEPWFSGSGIKFCFENCSYIPQPSQQKSDISSDISLSQMLRTCQRHFKANRLTTGRGGNALDCYSEVLEKDRNNAEALEGLEKIEAKYLAWIKYAVRRGKRQKALQYMAALRKVNPETQNLRAYEYLLETEPVVTSKHSRQAGQVFQDRLKDGGKGPEMVWIKAGSFQMGSNEGRSNEKPVHRVSITKDFGMGRYEVTFAEYDKFAQATGREKPSDSGWGRGTRPVINVSWHDAVAYAEWLSKQTGQKYRLPTEAEWEYVARAGTTTQYWWGNSFGSNKANCGYGSTKTVGTFKANPFGIYDTAGNVWEWVQDIYSRDYYSNSIYSDPTGPSTGSFRVLRGGGWFNTASYCRAAFRILDSPGDRVSGLGFRLLRQP